MNKTDTPAKVASNDRLGLLPITRHDHPEPQTMVWSEIELQAIRAYAGRCVAAERKRWRAAAVPALAWMEGAWSRIDGEWGPSGKTLDQECTDGDEPEIAALRSLLRA